MVKVPAVEGLGNGYLVDFDCGNNTSGGGRRKTRQRGPEINISCLHFIENMIVRGLLEDTEAGKIIILLRTCAVINISGWQPFDVTRPSRNVFWILCDVLCGSLPIIVLVRECAAIMLALYIVRVLWGGT